MVGGFGTMSIKGNDLKRANIKVLPQGPPLACTSLRDDRLISKQCDKTAQENGVKEFC